MTPVGKLFAALSFVSAMIFGYQSYQLNELREQIRAYGDRTEQQYGYRVADGLIQCRDTFSGRMVVMLALRFVLVDQVNR